MSGTIFLRSIYLHNSRPDTVVENSSNLYCISVGFKIKIDRRSAADINIGLWRFGAWNGVPTGSCSAMRKMGILEVNGWLWEPRNKGLAALAIPTLENVFIPLIKMHTMHINNIIAWAFSPWEIRDRVLIKWYLKWRR